MFIFAALCLVAGILPINSPDEHQCEHLQDRYSQ
jgi:hypothetical protein